MKPLKRVRTMKLYTVILNSGVTEQILALRLEQALRGLGLGFSDILGYTATDEF